MDNGFILVGSKDTQKISIANSRLPDLDFPPFIFHEPFNDDGTVFITLAENGKYFLTMCLGIGPDITTPKLSTLESTETSDKTTSGKSSTMENSQTGNDIKPKKSSTLKNQDLTDDLLREKLVNKTIKFLLCVRFNKSFDSPDFQKSCEHFLCVFGTEAVKSMILIISIQTDNELSSDQFTSKLYETDGYKYLKEKNNNNDIPFVSWHNNNNKNTNSYQFTKLREHASKLGGLEITPEMWTKLKTKISNQANQLNSKRDLLTENYQTENNKKLEMVIVFAEKSETDGTYVAFRQLFNAEFQPGTCNYGQVSVNKQPITLFYLNLSEKKHNPKYAKELEQLLTSRQVLLVICFEYCNPRVQEIDQNIRELRSMFDVNKLRFVFYTDKDREIERTKLVAQLREFLECRFIDNLETRVFLLNESIRLGQLLDNDRFSSTAGSGNNQSEDETKKGCLIV